MICARCLNPITGPYLNTGSGFHHVRCWLERTAP